MRREILIYYYLLIYRLGRWIRLRINIEVGTKIAFSVPDEYWANVINKVYGFKK